MGDALPELGELEREVMRLVWAHAPITAETVRERLDRRLEEIDGAHGPAAAGREGLREPQR